MAISASSRSRFKNYLIPRPIAAHHSVDFGYPARALFGNRISGLISKLT